MKRKVYRTLVVLFAVTVVVAVVLIASAELTSRPGFCSTCHYMKPYVEAWKTSSHADVTCTDCHFPPGIKSKVKGKLTAISMVVNYMTGVYKKSKPWAEISDASCLRSGCHEERLLEGEVGFKEAIIFDHKPHLTKLRRNKKLRCTSCHSQIVQGEHISVTESTCFLCHFKNQPDEAAIDNCTRCHEAPVAKEAVHVKYDHTFVAKQNIKCLKCHGQMQVGDGAVPIERCSSCHAEIGKIEQFEDVDFMHKNHVTDHKIECQNCHLVIQHKSISRTMAIMPECQSCHQKSHQAQLDLFSGTGGKGVPKHPNPMYEHGLNCQACHIYHEFEKGLKELGETIVAKAESCEICHGPGYAKILNQWQSLMTEKISAMERVFNKVESELNLHPVSEKVKQQTLYLMEDVRYNLQMVQQGNVVHNVAFSDELLSSANESLIKVLNILESDIVLPDFSVYSRLVPSECKNCHYGQEEINVEVFGVSFPHNVHVTLQQLECSQCHSNIRLHGELIVNRNACLSCHHTQEEVDCEQCHELQAQFYDGTVKLISEVIPDVMYEEDVECLSCHEGVVEPIEKATGEHCLNCHDSDYKDLFVEWEHDTDNSINNINDKLFSMNKENLSESDKNEVERIRYGIDLIGKDGSNGAHNIVLVEQILSEYNDILKELPVRIVD